MEFADLEAKLAEFSPTHRSVTVPAKLNGAAISNKTAGQSGTILSNMAEFGYPNYASGTK